MVVTRPVPAAEETACLLSERGWRPLIAPFLTIHTLPFAPLETPVQAVLVTSMNALPSLPVDLHATPLYAVGDATAMRAKALGFLVVYSARGDAEDLSALIRHRLLPEHGPLLLVSGEGQGDELAASLRAFGFQLIRRINYTADPPERFPVSLEQQLMVESPYAILFFSTRTAAHFAKLLPPSCCTPIAETYAIALSAAVAQAVEHLVWRAIHVSSSRDQAAMLDCLPPLS